MSRPYFLFRTAAVTAVILTLPAVAGAQAARPVADPLPFDTTQVVVTPEDFKQLETFLQATSQEWGKPAVQQLLQTSVVKYPMALGNVGTNVRVPAQLKPGVMIPIPNYALIADSVPTVAQGLAKASMTGRRYLQLSRTLNVAWVTDELDRGAHGGQPQVTETNTVVGKNVAFIRAHQAEFKNLVSIGLDVSRVPGPPKLATKANWQNLDLQTDSVFGVGTERAYTELLATLKPKQRVVVAVIDAGVDTAHEDLRGVLWANPKEQPGNGKDDDRDGYVDDVNGWNFLGGAKGSIRDETLEITRLVRAMRPKYGSVADTSKLSPAERDSLATYNKLNAEFERQRATAGPSDHSYDLSFDPRNIVGDNPNDYSDRRYGNADVTGPHALHGTHVAGIIGAMRDNDLGIKGIADAVRIMSVRAVPDGDERDKDVANAIRFAADHGAKVINMSFGKAYGANKAAVDAAVKYALSKDVLLVHAAGNEAKDLDTEQNYPNRTYADGSGTAAAAWLEVGASTWRDDASLPARFSNYGKTTVDLFAPGARIYSTLPGSQYQELDGTSMAAPVVAGVAALVRSRYPQLTAVQVKDILMKSVTKVEHPVTTPGNGPSVPFSELCVSGGVVNVYNALKLAATSGKPSYRSALR